MKAFLDRKGVFYIQGDKAFLIGLSYEKIHLPGQGDYLIIWGDELCIVSSENRVHYQPFSLRKLLSLAYREVR